jgi:hypothetical protein
MPTNQYYPTLSTVVSLNDFPDYLGFIKEGIGSIFDNIYIKDLQTSISPRGESGFYGLSIVSRKRLQFEIPGTGILFVLNPDNTDTEISSFPVTVEYQWLILQFINNFNLDNFSFSAVDFYNLGLQILNISEQDVLQTVINNIVQPASESISPLEQFVNDINENYNLTVPLPQSENKIRELVLSIRSLYGSDASVAIFGLYLVENGNPLNSLERTKDFFRYLIPEDIETYLKRIITPTARVTLALSAAIEFPQTILKPANLNGTPYVPASTKSQFRFAQALLYADTELGVGFQLELGGSLYPEIAQIGNTGILLEIDSLKLDLSKNSNIPEADADGRPEDFIGVYARALSVTLPARWFHDEAVQGTTATTLRLAAYDFLMGTGGLSGTIMLETVPSIISGGDTYYFDEEFELHFPIALFEKNLQTNVVEEIIVQDLSELKLKLFHGGSGIPSIALKFPITLTERPIATGETKTFTTIFAYQEYLNSFAEEDIDSPMLWKKVGSSSSGFKVGFKSFDITFKQNKVISSNINGKLEIKKFVRPGTSDPVNISISGHLDDNGDFNLTASTQPPYPIELKDIFTYQVKTVELGRENDDFYLGTSGTLQFEGFLKDTLKLDSIEIERLRIYSDGSFEFIGGSVQLIDPVVLPLGPISITVSAIHYGSIQKEVNGFMRKFNYFGFDGGISIDPFGIEVRGDGVKYYYCVDDVEGQPKPKAYLHIQTLYLDLTLPADSGSLAQINGWVNIPEPGISKEYAGGVTLRIPSAKLAGKADIRLAPKYPAFIVDCELEPSIPITLGTFAIYGFRGLLGYRYVAEKEAVGLVSGVNTWYEYYKFPKRGININKFSGPEQTAGYSTPISLGAGATLGTGYDDGYTLSIKAMALFSIPSLFMLDGRAAILTKRLGLDESQDPPFFAFVAVGDDSLEFGFGADYKLPNNSGDILSIYADIQAGFFFKNQHPWYVNIGTNINPVTARIITLLTIKSYVMLSARGIEAGARGDFNFDRNYGVIKVKAHAFVEIGGRISFEKPQFGSYLMAGVEASVKVLFMSLSLEVGILFGVEAPRPFLIYGKFYFKVKVGIKIFGKRITLFKFSGDLEVVWNFNKNIDRAPINPLIYNSNETVLADLVQGVNMLSNEKFALTYLQGIPVETVLPSEILDNIIPLDTYIDIRTEKGLLPGNAQDPNNSVRKLIGGINNAPTKYEDLIPPISSIRGRSIRQVKHQYSIEEIVIKFWNTTTGKWDNYHPYEALYPNDPNVKNLKVGQFQKNDGQYNAVRLLATTPFSYTEQGQPGWYIPEQYGINASTLFCEAEHRERLCADFLQKAINARYYCSNPNTPLFSNDVAFTLISRNEEDFAYITDENNQFGFTKSLGFDNRNSVELLLPKPSLMASLKLSNFTNGVRIKFYSVIQSGENDVLFNVVYGNPNPEYHNVTAPYEIVLFGHALEQEIKYNVSATANGSWNPAHPNWRPVSKIVIEPIFQSSYLQQVALLNEQIAVVENNNNLINLGIIDGEIISTDNMEDQVHNISCGAAGNSISFVNRYHKKDALNYYYSKEFAELKDFNGNSTNYIYSIGSTGKNGLITKVTSNGDVVWEKIYSIVGSEKKIIFKRIIQISRIINSTQPHGQCILHGTTGDTHYLFSIDPEDGSVIWSKKIVWEDQDIVIHIAPDSHYGEFYLVISDRNLIDTSKKPYVAIINSFGNTLSGTFLDIEGEELIVNSICPTDEGLVVAGRFIEGKYGDSVGTIIQLDDELKIVDAIRIGKYYTTIHDIKALEDDRYLVSGYDNKQDGLFISVIGTAGIYTSYHFPNTKNHRSVIQLAQDGYYLLQDDDQNGILHFLKKDLTLQWSKEINIGNLSNGIRNFTFSQASSHITLNCYNQTEGSLVVHTDKYLNSCLTNIFDIVNIKRIDIPVEKVLVTQDYTELELEELEVITERIDSLVKKYCSVGGCGDKDIRVCDLYDYIGSIYFNELVEPSIVSIRLIQEFAVSFRKITSAIDQFDTKYELHQNLSTPISQINRFIDKQDMNNYSLAYGAIEQIRNYLVQIGHCTCDCDADEITMLHQVCWMSIEDYQYNINIPSQEAIAADAQATIDGINRYIQPIWRPDTSYYVHFILKDVVDNGAGTLYPFTYGFTTAGPVGFFHNNERSTYGDIVLKNGDTLLKEDRAYFTVVANGLQNSDGTLYINSNNGFILEDTTGRLKNASTGHLYMMPDNPGIPVRVLGHPEQYPLTSIKPYIDYSRSYPNADGNLLGAKPLFYNDQEFFTTQIKLFFSKAYATHFFQKWESYKRPEGAVTDNVMDGRLKIVIKDPVEGVEIINPPYLDYDENDTEYVNIPQSEEIWEVDQNPQVPFAISHYLNLYNAPNCIGDVTIIKPTSQYMTIFPKNLKPNKLYTVIVNNIFDVDHNGSFGDTASIKETREVHSFVFKTSRYKDFSEQVNSFYLEHEINGLIAQRQAMLKFEKEFGTEEISAAIAVISGQPLTGFSNEILNNLELNYQHAYDKVFEGIFGFKPWDEPVSTEVNVIKDINSGNIIALIIRNPEPFNDPKIPIVDIRETIQVLESNPEEYRIMFSKDYSQAIIMEQSGNFERTLLTLRFTYKFWDGLNYVTTNNHIDLPININIF